jgi:hypothetical protein
VCRKERVDALDVVSVIAVELDDRRTRQPLAEDIGTSMTAGSTSTVGLDPSTSISMRVLVPGAGGP